MWNLARKLVLAVAALALFSPAARAQVQVTPNTTIRLSADASVGYVQSSAQEGFKSLNIGLGADLLGHYYHPNFLQFQFSPYYNHGREYSGADFVAGEKGFASSVNLFGGSEIPLYINYTKSKIHSGLYGVAGTGSNVVGEGGSDSLGVSWTLRPPRLPSLQLGYSRGGGEYRILGANENLGKSHTSGYLLGSQYTLFGFAMGASYSANRLEQVVPGVFLTDQQKSQTNTDQKVLQFSLSRQLMRTMSFDATATRSRLGTDATTQAQDRRYDMVQAGLNARPVNRLTASFRVNYVSDLNALLLGSILPGSMSPSARAFTLIPSESLSRYVTYSAASGYELTRMLSLRATFRHGTGRFSARTDTKDTVWNNAANFRHELVGGHLSASYSLGMYRYASGAFRNSSQGHSGTMTFSRFVRGWEHSVLAQYSTSDIESLLPGQLRSFSSQWSSSGMVGGWRLVTSFRYERSESVFRTETDNRRRSFRVALSKSSLNLAATMQSGRGLSIVTVTGPQPASVAQAVAAGSELERLLIPTDSHALSFTASYQLGKRTSLNGSLSRMSYTTRQAGSVRENELNQMDANIRHWFRRLDCRAGFRRYHQKFSAVSGLYNANTFYFQVSRHFDVF